MPPPTPLPILTANDIVSVQPMTAPAGLLFGPNYMEFSAVVTPAHRLEFIQVTIELKPHDPDNRFREIIDEVE